MYGSYGNLSIKEENSRSRDIGMEYSSFNKQFITEITFFSTQIDNLIGYASLSPYKFENQGSAQNNGIEIFHKIYS